MKQYVSKQEITTGTGIDTDDVRQRRKRGRPKGSKDNHPRKQRQKASGGTGPVYVTPDKPDQRFKKIKREALQVSPCRGCVKNNSEYPCNSADCEKYATWLRHYKKYKL